MHQVIVMLFIIVIIFSNMFKRILIENKSIFMLELVKQGKDFKNINW